MCRSSQGVGHAYLSAVLANKLDVGVPQGSSLRTSVEPSYVVDSAEKSLVGSSGTSRVSKTRSHHHAVQACALVGGHLCYC